MTCLDDMYLMTESNDRSSITIVHSILLEYSHFHWFLTFERSHFQHELNDDMSATRSVGSGFLLPVLNEGEQPMFVCWLSCVFEVMMTDEGEMMNKINRLNDVKFIHG